MWNSRKVGEWIERQIGRNLNNKKQRGWEYLKRMGRSLQVPRPITHPPTNASRRPLKKAPDEGDEAQGGPPHGEGGALVRGRAAPGPQADRAQGVEPHRSEASGEGAPEIPMDLPLRLRAP